MIRYALKCAHDHSFESWFASADAFDKLRATGAVTCPICGSSEVDKAIMAPRVTTAKRKAVGEAKPAGALAAPMSEMEAQVAKLRRHVEENSDYVGLGFAKEARKMHEGEIPHRAIYGEARPNEAKALVEDGIPVAPLPFTPQRKTN